MPDAIHELDTVAVTLDLPTHRLVRGQVGTVVMELSPTDVEVEFVDTQGATYALVALPKSSLLRLHHQRIEAA